MPAPRTLWIALALSTASIGLLIGFIALYVALVD